MNPGTSAIISSMPVWGWLQPNSPGKGQCLPLGNSRSGHLNTIAGGVHTMVDTGHNQQIRLSPQGAASAGKFARFAVLLEGWNHMPGWGRNQYRRAHSHASSNWHNVGLRYKAQLFSCCQGLKDAWAMLNKLLSWQAWLGQQVWAKSGHTVSTSQPCPCPS